VSGSDGCNQFTGSYELKGDAIAFSQLAATQMACINIGDIDRTFRDALERTTRVTAAADRLQFSDAAGTRLAVFAAPSSLPNPRQRI
jgi:heat shock protein HslJ